MMNGCARVQTAYMNSHDPDAPPRDLRPRVAVVVPLIVASLLACWVIVKLGQRQDADEAAALVRKTNVLEVAVNKRRVVRTNEVLVPAPPEEFARPPARGPTNRLPRLPKPVGGVETNGVQEIPPPLVAKTLFEDVLPNGGGLHLGAVMGRVELHGVPPPEKELPIGSMDPMCAALPSRSGFLTGTRRTTSFYRVATNGGLADVFVVLTGVEGRFTAATNAPALGLVQSGCLYSPYISAVMVGQRVVVTNLDSSMHNLHVISTNAVGNRNGVIDHALMKGQKAEVRFTGPQMFVKFMCNVRPWMFAYVCVVDHPWFAVTDAEGRFSIPHVPPGRYVLEAHHRKAGITRQEVEVVAGHETEAPLVLDAK